jgi:hypothetical protein
MNSSDMLSVKALQSRRSHQVISLIKATTSLQQLQLVLQQHGPQLNQVSLSAAIVHLVKLNVSSRPEHRRMLKSILEEAWELLEQRGQLEQLQARQLSNIIWACSKLRYSANLHLYRQCLVKFGQRLEEAAPQSISNVLYAITKQPLLQALLPDDTWLQQLLDAFCGMLGEATPQAISNTLWSVAVLRRQVPQEQLSMVLGVLQGLLDHTNALDLSNTLWAVATMGGSVPEAALPAFLARFTAVLPSATAQVLSSTVWAVATMGVVPPEHQLRQWVTSFLAMLPKAKVHHISSMLWAVATMGYQVTQQQQDRLLRILTSQIGQANRGTVFQALDAVSRLQCRPSNGLLSDVAGAAGAAGAAAGALAPGSSASGSSNSDTAAAAGLFAVHTPLAGEMLLPGVAPGVVAAGGGLSTQPPNAAADPAGMFPGLMAAATTSTSSQAWCDPAAGPLQATSNPTSSSSSNISSSEGVYMQPAAPGLTSSSSSSGGGGVVWVSQGLIQPPANSAALVCQPQPAAINAPDGSGYVVMSSPLAQQQQQQQQQVQLLMPMPGAEGYLVASGGMPALQQQQQDAMQAFPASAGLSWGLPVASLPAAAMMPVVDFMAGAPQQ